MTSCLTSLSRRSLLVALSTLALPLSAQPAWPARPVHIIVAYPAGGVSDAIARVLGVFAPAGVPQPVLERLNAKINNALTLPDVRSRLVGSENVPTGGSARDFVRHIAAESASNAKIIRAAGIKLE